MMRKTQNINNDYYVFAMIKKKLLKPIEII